MLEYDQTDGREYADVDAMDVDTPVASGSGTSSRSAVIRPREDDTPDRARERVERAKRLRSMSEPVPLRTDGFLVGYVYHEEMMLHADLENDDDRRHPEKPERISRIYEALRNGDCLSYMRRIPIRPVLRYESLLVHSEEHWEKVENIALMTKEDIIMSAQYYESLSLYVHPKTTRAAKLSCGGVIEACLAVAEGRLRKSFAIVRPPGHHAEPDEHMGFCFFNNVAVAARVVQQKTKLKKILILDWDVHHGNGTQRAFNDDASVLYISIHRYEGGQFYPCGSFGDITSCGEGPGKGFSVNIPWPSKGMNDADYLFAFERIVMPIAREFAPELVIISAGFDAAAGDDLGECFVSPAGYAHMTHMLCSLAGGKVAVALEGGYNLTAISSSALAVAKVILGQSPPELPPMVASEIGTETVWQVAMYQSKYWKGIDPKGVEPKEEIRKFIHSIPEMLKAHREYFLRETHHMLEIPLVGDDMKKQFSGQIMCTPDIMDNDALVVLVHEFGNLRVELDGSITCNVQLENSYVLDFSKAIIEWVAQKQYAMLDVNMFPRPFTRTAKSKSLNDISRDLVTYLWDNYIQLSSAKRVVLIGHGPGCNALMHLIDARRTSVTQNVRLVVQCTGYDRIPAVPKVNRAWYFQTSLVVVPRNHPTLLDGNVSKKHGELLVNDETKPIKLIMKALPAIQSKIEEKLGSGVMQVAEQPLIQSSNTPAQSYLITGQINPVASEVLRN